MRPLKHFITHPKDLLSSFLKIHGKNVPDKLYLQIQYYLLMGKRLNLKTPTTFSEKIQWLKLYNRKPEMTTMVDKFAVKDYVAGIIGDKYVIPTYGIWDSLEEVDWDSLPEKFVLKTTHGGGGTGVVVVKSKSNTDRVTTLEKLRWSYYDDGYTRNREWPYKNIKRRIIAEKLIEMPDKSDLNDYKFFCFDGEPRFFKVDFDRFTEHHANYYDLNWNLLPYGEKKIEPQPGHEILPPPNFRKMIDIARQLSLGHYFLRVDLYNVLGTIYFSELTFYPASGLEKWTPEAADEILGKYISL